MLTSNKYHRSYNEKIVSVFRSKEIVYINIIDINYAIQNVIWRLKLVKSYFCHLLIPIYLCSPLGNVRSKFENMRQNQYKFYNSVSFTTLSEHFQWIVFVSFLKENEIWLLILNSFTVTHLQKTCHDCVPPLW